MKTKQIILLLLAFSCFATAADAQTNWLGKYDFFEDGGQTAGGTSISVGHMLEVVEGDDGLIGFVQSTGYQTSRDLICRVKVEGVKMMIYFESYGEDNVFEPYERGDLLFTIERKVEKGKQILLTHWGKFEPIVPQNARSGREYFVKRIESK